jgi:hypothetical protein
MHFYARSSAEPSANVGQKSVAPAQQRGSQR